MCRVWGNDAYGQVLHVRLICDGKTYRFTSDDMSTTGRTSVNVLSMIDFICDF